MLPKKPHLIHQPNQHKPFKWWTILLKFKSQLKRLPLNKILIILFKRHLSILQPNHLNQLKQKKPFKWQTLRLRFKYQSRKLLLKQKQTILLQSNQYKPFKWLTTLLKFKSLFNRLPLKQIVFKWQTLHLRFKYQSSKLLQKLLIHLLQFNHNLLLIHHYQQSLKLITRLDKQKLQSLISPSKARTLFKLQRYKIL